MKKYLLCNKNFIAFICLLLLVLCVIVIDTIEKNHCINNGGYWYSDSRGQSGCIYGGNK